MLFTMLIVRTPNIYTASGRVMALLVIPWQQEEFKMAATVNPNLREIVKKALENLFANYNLPTWCISGR